MFTQRCIYYFFSLEALVLLRQTQTKKICYSSKLNFLQLKLYPTQTVSNLHTKHGLYLKFYFLFRKAYLLLLREHCKNLIENHELPDKIEIENKLRADSPFIEYYVDNINAKNLDYCLQWRGEQVRPLFRVESVEKKKKKRRYWIRYVTEEKRILLVLRWFVLITILSRQKKQSIIRNLKWNLKSFLFHPDDCFQITKVKLDTYRFYLLKIHDIMLVISAVKLLVLGISMITLAGGAIGTGILFAGYNLSVAKNPEEAENLFNTTLMAFALIETFIFLSFLIGGIVYIL